MQWQIQHAQQVQSVEQLLSVLASLRSLSLDELESPASFETVTPSFVGIDEKQLAKAVKTIQLAVKSEKTIVILGDYDADGVCATTVLLQALQHLNAVVHPFIPKREVHGYGLSLKVIEDIVTEFNPALIITVDNGIVAHVSAQAVLEKGIQLIITDHHQPEEELPPATAIVHTTSLCGTGVSWVLAGALAPEFASEGLDLVGVATIADQVPLAHANRVLAREGIRKLQKTKRVGLRALYEMASIVPETIDEQTVNYTLAPRINAMGRLSHGLEAVHLLAATDVTFAQNQAAVLSTTNVNRQELTASMFEDAQLQAKQWETENIVIVHSSEYHEGVIGLLAGKLVEQFHKPAIVLSVGEKTAKASARSVKGVNIVELIRKVREELTEVGGHPMAAGFGLVKENVQTVIDKLRAVASADISTEMLEARLVIDAVVDPKIVSASTVKMLAKLKPFGQGNPEPLLIVPGLVLLDFQSIGRDGRHARLVLQDENTKRTYTGIWWSGYARVKELSLGEKFDVVAMMQLNVWKGRESVQLSLQDIETASSIAPL